jgi:RNA polymerase sigma-70 factor (ECF subfamily)
MSAFAQGKARYRRGTLLSRIGELFSARLGNRQAAEDVAHDAYLRVLERTEGEQIEHPRRSCIAPR